MMKGRTASAALLGLLACAATVSGQDLEFGYGRIPGWSFTPSVSVGAMYDTNIRLRDASVATGETEGDRLIIVAPSGRLEFAGRRTTFSAGYQGFIRRYETAEQLDRFSHQSLLSLRHAFTRTLTGFARHTFRHVPTTDDLEVEGAPFVRQGSRAQSFGGGLDLRLTRLTTMSAAYEETRITFDRPEEFLTGGWLRSVRVDGRRRLTGRAAVGAEYALRFAEVDEGSRNLTFQDAGAVLTYDLSQATSLSASGGLSHLNDRTADETRLGPYVRLAITHEVPRVTVGGGYERRFVPSFGFGGANATQELRGFVTMPLARNRMYVQGSAAWRHSNPYSEASVEIDTVWIRSTLGYALNRWLRTEGFYIYTLRDSIVTGGEISRHRTGVQVVVAQPMRIR